MFFIIALCKIIAWFLSLFGRGSSLPGSVALRLMPNILRKMRLPELIIAVTGSNGKTSTTELIYELAKKTGKSAICNHEGSNQTEGVVTLFIKHSSLFGKVQADIAVIESDERFCQYTFRTFAPQFMVVTNLFRDQMTRNGHNEFVCEELKKGIPSVTTLILNADDPLSASLGCNRNNVLYFGIDPLAFFESEPVSRVFDDGRHCPLCGGFLTYKYRLHHHLGAFRCRNCGYSRFTPLHSVTALTGRHFVLDGIHDIRPQMINSMFAGNLSAAYTAGIEALGLTGEVIAETLDGYIMKNNRLKRFSAGNHKGIFMLSKHENTMSYDGAIDNVIKSRSREKTVVVIFDLLSRKYIANDISWLWDINFELLKTEKVKKIILSGAFAYDLAMRFDFTGIDKSIISVQPDVRTMAATLDSSAVGEIFVMTCFTDIGNFSGRLKGEFE